jgi:anti-sigma factor RsiW
VTGDTHYDPEILAELAEGLLDDATAREVRGHLAICDACGERLADLAAVREVLAAMPVPVMPMGVALRVDQALAAEAERAAKTAPAAPDWDRIMRDAPWETESPIKEAPLREMPPLEVLLDDRADDRADEPVPALGVVRDDGSVDRRPSRAGRPSRRRWGTSLSPAAAAAGVLGGVGLATTLLNDGGSARRPAVLAESATTGTTAKTHTSAASHAATDRGTDTTSYPVGSSGYIYADAELDGPLVRYFGAQPGLGGTDSDPKLNRCIKSIVKKVGSKPIGVDKAYYNGSEAAIMVFWHDKAANSVEVRVVNPDCKNMRKPGLATWN